MTINASNLKVAIEGKRIINNPDYWFLPYDGININGESKNLIVIGLNSKGDKTWLSNYSCIDKDGKTFLSIENTEYEVLQIISSFDEINKATVHQIEIIGSNGKPFIF